MKSEKPENTHSHQNIIYLSFCVLCWRFAPFSLQKTRERDRQEGEKKVLLCLSSSFLLRDCAGAEDGFMSIHTIQSEDDIKEKMRNHVEATKWLRWCWIESSSSRSVLCAASSIYLAKIIFLIIINILHIVKKLRKASSHSSQWMKAFRRCFRDERAHSQLSRWINNFHELVLVKPIRV